MHISELQNQESETEDVFRFDKSLKELRDLRSQLHFAADYCENTFLNANDKRTVVENTKEYICRALVTVVDHLGSVSANLNYCISDTNDFTDAELRVISLKQRLLSCEKYAHKLALNKVRWSVAFPRYHRHYLLNGNSRDAKFSSATKITNKHEIDKEEVPLFMSSNTDKSSPVKNLASKTAVEKCDPSSTLVLPVRDGNSTLSKAPNPNFQFQLGTPNLARNRSLRRKSLQSNDIKSLIWRIRRSK